MLRECAAMDNSYFMNSSQYTTIMDNFKGNVNYSDIKILLKNSLSKLYGVKFHNDRITDHGELSCSKLKLLPTISAWLKALGLSDASNIMEWKVKCQYKIINFIEDEFKTILNSIPVNEIKKKNVAIYAGLELRQRLNGEIFCFEHIVTFQEFLLLVHKTVLDKSTSKCQKELWNEIIGNKYFLSKLIQA